MQHAFLWVIVSIIDVGCGEGNLQCIMQSFWPAIRGKPSGGIVVAVRFSPLFPSIHRGFSCAICEFINLHEPRNHTACSNRS